jgi:hypothetical protein
MRGLEERLAEVERVNARVEEDALSTACGLGEVSRHWDAVYDAMRRADRIDRQLSSEPCLAALEDLWFGVAGYAGRNDHGCRCSQRTHR